MTKNQEAPQISRRDAAIAAHRAAVLAQEAAYRATVEAADKPAGIDWTYVGAN